VATSPEWALFFFDESRFGTHSKSGLGWFKKGERTPVPVKLGFQNFYLYSAVNPRTGEDFTWIAPQVNAEHLNVFLEKFSEFLGERKAILVWDGAGWHKARKLVVPNNIVIEQLPPYSPELNPVERFWKFIKDNTIKNKVFDTLLDLEETISDFLKTLTSDCVASICHVNYL